MKDARRFARNGGDRPVTLGDLKKALLAKMVAPSRSSGWPASTRPLISSSTSLTSGPMEFLHPCRMATTIECASLRNRDRPRSRAQRMTSLKLNAPPRNSAGAFSRSRSGLTASRAWSRKRGRRSGTSKKGSTKETTSVRQEVTSSRTRGESRSPDGRYRRTDQVRQSRESRSGRCLRRYLSRSRPSKTGRADLSSSLYRNANNAWTTSGHGHRGAAAAGSLVSAQPKASGSPYAS
ncbi:hypothetical protein ACVIM8_001617 [Bradyrhizobium sp. USDA 4529]